MYIHVNIFFILACTSIAFADAFPQIKETNVGYNSNKLSETRSLISAWMSNFRRMDV